MLDFFMLIGDAVFGILDLFSTSQREGMDGIREALDDKVTEWLADLGLLVCLVAAWFCWDAGAKLWGLIFGAGAVWCLVRGLMPLFRNR